MVKLKIVKQCQQSSHLFKTFIQKTTKQYSSLPENLKIVYLAISFSSVYFAVRG